MRKILLIILIVSTVGLSAPRAGWEYSLYHVPPNMLWGCEALDSLTFWACGHTDYIIKSTDSGETWSESYSTVDGYFYELDFYGHRFGWAVEGLYPPIDIIATIDSGESWRIIYEDMDLSWVSGLEFADSLNGFISGIIAVASIVSLIYLVEKNIPEIKSIHDNSLLAFMYIIIILLGIIISLFSTRRAVYKYLKMPIEHLY